MKTYIQPSIEIIAAINIAILAGSDIHDEIGDEGEGSNTGVFDEEFSMTKSSLWDE